jgi:hypothetical protein
MGVNQTAVWNNKLVLPVASDTGQVILYNEDFKSDLLVTPNPSFVRCVVEWNGYLACGHQDGSVQVFDYQYVEIYKSV